VYGSFLKKNINKGKKEEATCDEVLYLNHLDWVDGLM